MVINVILADDHKILRAGLKSLLESDHNIKIVAESDNGRETVALARQLSPDIVVMDVAMPDMNGVEATKKITQQDTIDFIKYRQLVAEGALMDEDAFEAVLGSPAE